MSEAITVPSLMKYSFRGITCEGHTHSHRHTQTDRQTQVSSKLKFAKSLTIFQTKSKIMKLGRKKKEWKPTAGVAQAESVHFY